MKKIIRIKDDYGVKKDILIDNGVDLSRLDEVYCDYTTYTVTKVVYDVEESTIYFVCEQK